MQKNKINCIKHTSFLCIAFLFGGFAKAQKPVTDKPNPSVNTLQIVTQPKMHSVSDTNADPFNSKTNYITNIGQYGNTLASYGKMGIILYGYEGMGMPVLFTAKGLIHLQRKTKKMSYKEMEEIEKKGLKTKDKTDYVDRTVTMEWVNANPNPLITAEDLSNSYFTYGMLKEKARAYKKIIYKELYPGIDLVYSFVPSQHAGFEYSLIVKPGADISKIKMRYGGNVKNISYDRDGSLVVKSDIDEISVTDAVCYYTDNNGQKSVASFLINKNEISFKLPLNYDATKTLVIDPFVSSTGILTGSGSYANKAKDIDFDYAGNIYVSGGGDGSAQKMVKYDPGGSVLWTFNGTVTTPNWSFGPSQGGWVVEKQTGNIYLGQGLASGGSRVIRLNAAGVYDNYITTANNSFAENWKMIWNCNNGVPQMLIAGGGGNANNELAILEPPGVVPVASNISGITGGHHDISDIFIDPVSNDMYTIFSVSTLTPLIDAKIYKHKPPYKVADIAWTAVSGYFALREPVNRPYNGGFDNSSNTIAINANYLFYWDGKNLKAFNKADGSTAGTPSVFSANLTLMQGGIVADECNNIFVGWTGGTIKVFKFNGTVFDDNAAPDITVPYTGSVYDMVYDNGKSLLYACGNGFIASFDISGYCASQLYIINTVIDCPNLSVAASISPNPPAGTVVTYNLYTGPTLVASNSTGIFTGLTSTNYTIIALLNQACSGTQAITNFTITGSPSLIINTPAAICMGNTIDLTDAAITAGSGPGLTFTYWLNATATVPYPAPATATAGIYYIKASTLSGCSVIKPVTVIANPTPVVNAGADTTLCFGNNLQLNATGGLTYTWSPATYLSNPNIANPVFNSPVAIRITYNLNAKNAFGCSSDDQINISVTSFTKVFIGNDTAIGINHPLQLYAIDVNNTGLNNFLWSPVSGLNNPFIANPIAVLDHDMTYYMFASTPFGCKAFDTINIKVYPDPEIYVPNAFTPNNNATNDQLKAIPVGMKAFHFFRIFNRFGEQVFFTADPSKGWDGRIKGKLQNTGTYVWIAEAIDYRGNLIQRNGTTILIQ
jgi:gliding motility-associated-like protein